MKQNNISIYSEVEKVSPYYSVTHSYWGKRFYCGVCLEKSVILDKETFRLREEWINKSVSSQSIEEIIKSYNIKHNVKESDYWKCLQDRCDLDTDDDRINNVRVFKKRSLMNSYTYIKPNNHNFWG